MRELTKRQDKILDYIEQYDRKHGRPPSYQEIQTHFGFASPTAVADHIRAIEKKGYLQIRKGSRGLHSLRPPAHEVPLVGRIAAGAPIEAIENIETKLDLSPLGIDNSKGKFFALRVKGNSMINAHIMDGDMVVIQKQPMVSDSDIAAVIWNEEATLKYVRNSEKDVLLVPANDAMEPIVVQPDRVHHFEILGKVVLVIRTNP